MQRQQPAQGWTVGTVAMLALMLAAGTLLCLPAFAETGDNALPPNKMSAFAVPRMSQPPVIDGDKALGNWADARVTDEGVSD